MDFKPTKQLIHTIFSGWQGDVMTAIFAALPWAWNFIAEYDLAKRLGIEKMSVFETWIVCLLLLFFGLLAKTLKRLIDLETAKFTLIFENNPEFEIQDNNRSPDGKVSVNHRIGIRGLSSTTIKDVKVTLSYIERNGKTQYLGRNLLVAPDARTDHVNLNSNTEYFWFVEFTKEKLFENYSDNDYDFLIENLNDTGDSKPYFRFHNDPSIFYHDGVVNVGLSISGNGSAPVNERFCLELSEETFKCNRLT